MKRLKLIQITTYAYVEEHTTPEEWASLIEEVFDDVEGVYHSDCKAINYAVLALPETDIKWRIGDE